MLTPKFATKIASAGVNNFDIKIPKSARSLISIFVHNVTMNFTHATIWLRYPGKGNSHYLGDIKTLSQGSIPINLPLDGSEIIRIAFEHCAANDELFYSVLFSDHKINETCIVQNAEKLNRTILGGLVDWTQTNDSAMSAGTNQVEYTVPVNTVWDIIGFTLENPDTASRTVYVDIKNVGGTAIYRLYGKTSIGATTFINETLKIPLRLIAGMKITVTWLAMTGSNNARNTFVVMTYPGSI